MELPATLRGRPDRRLLRLYGGYRDQANRCLLSELTPTSLANPRPGRLALPGGQPVPPGFVVGRGPCLHVIDATGWYRLDLRTLA